jgi:hypothetical protein
MRLNIKTLFVTTLYILLSGSVAAITIEHDKFSAILSPYFQTAPQMPKTPVGDAAHKVAINSEAGMLSEQCLDCVANGKPPANALVPDTDFLSFTATADPQINKSNANPRAAFQNDIARYLLAKLYNDQNYKGLIIAGDLTEHTYRWEILELYNALLGNEESDLGSILDRGKELDRLYEGLGNHDMRKGACCVSENDGESCVCESDLNSIISREDRQDQIRSQAPHYSWEWDGIRFIQLNLLPGDVPETVWNGSGRDPKDALTFLESELEDAGPDKNVIVIHHYGMDRFSKKWWSTETKNAYEEVIRDYRVVAIITGHLHWSRRSSNMQQCWNDVTAVTVGSVRLGFHLDFKVINDQLTVTRMRNGSPMWTDSYSIAQSNARFCGNNT